ncbi:Dgri\GH11874-PA-like protein [Anopheles sinensis]|uniref:Dgri\GH11874-PA-like protein n=1 Tax=Anopheles sinensis TaxID=74873 RepID=A0A084WNM4_ANOSI|nr:Dgri\GH11874-PA-like protein [Anopheles sinensis]
MVATEDMADMEATEDTEGTEDMEAMEVISLMVTDTAIQANMVATEGMADMEAMGQATVDTEVVTVEDTEVTVGLGRTSAKEVARSDPTYIKLV